MAKIITDVELAKIVRRVVLEKTGLKDGASYGQFLEALGTLVAEYCGGQRGQVVACDETLGWTCAFHIDPSVLADGGVYRFYDVDVTWKNGVETSH
jgi:hypothetical protein